VRASQRLVCLSALTVIFGACVSAAKDQSGSVRTCEGLPDIGVKAYDAVASVPSDDRIASDDYTAIERALMPSQHGEQIKHIWRARTATQRVWVLVIKTGAEPSPRGQIFALDKSAGAWRVACVMLWSS